MKKIIAFFFSILCILSVVNAQDITVFNFDGVTPTTSSWSDTFVSATNPLKTGINTSTNAGLYTHSTQWSSVSTAVNIDSRYYTSYSVDVYSTTGTGTAVVALFDASNKQLDWFSIPISGTAWTRYTRNLYCIGTVASVSVSYNIDQVPSATSANNIVYFDNLVFKEITSSFIPLYIETFYASVSQYGSWSGAPSTQAGNWFGGVNLQTTGDANINLNRFWNGDSHDDNLQI